MTQSVRDQRRVTAGVATMAHRQLWCEMHRRAEQAGLRMHRSDLLWDWEILKTYWSDGGFDFFWSAAETHTAITQDAQHAHDHLYDDAPHAWFVSVRPDRWGDLVGEFRELRDPIEALA